MDSTGTSQADDDPSYFDASLDEHKSPLREQDRFLPIANVAKIMKKSVPSSGKIAKEAKECVQECVSEFISFITSEAVDRCIEEKRKTVNGEDILFAIHALGFDNYLDPLKKFLLKYRETSKMDTSMFEETPGNTLLQGGTVYVSIPQPSIALQAAANQPGSTPIAARPITVIPSTSGDGQVAPQQIVQNENGTLTFASTGQPLIIQQQQLIKQEDDVKFTTATSSTGATILVPVVTSSATS
ncbi:hypothetical protein Ciccas_002041 [Cichlidogyrus casuarinus]|uniref:Transcription factor CBF/NF-Y/archaeal histone domain-containing protein n=1 Tax=Cichlidogyrus casuarinus TaxID=1844966 RepID=A0ABD2QLK0_9PLAT